MGEFIGKKKSVAVLPQSWYKDGTAYWPDYKNDDKSTKLQDQQKSQANNGPDMMPGC